MHTRNPGKPVMDDIPFHRITIIRPDGTVMPMERRASTSPFRPYGPADGPSPRAIPADGATAKPQAPGAAARERRQKRRRRAADAAGRLFDLKS